MFLVFSNVDEKNNTKPKLGTGGVQTPWTPS